MVGLSSLRAARRRGARAAADNQGIGVPARTLVILGGVPFAPAIDAEIYYEDTGGNGPIVLLAHEFLMDRTVFAGQMRELAPEFRIVCWDARGHGRTRDRGLPFTYWTSARDALTVLDHIGAERAVVGGVAQGGFSALRMALIAPRRVAALILISTEAEGPSPARNVMVRRFLDRWQNTTTRPDAAQHLADCLIGPEEHHRRYWIERWLTEERTNLDISARCFLGRDSIQEHIPTIACPALVIHTTAGFVAREQMRYLATTIPGSRYVEIEGARAAAPATHPGQVNRAMRQFLRTNSVPAGPVICPV